MVYTATMQRRAHERRQIKQAARNAKAMVEPGFQRPVARANQKAGKNPFAPPKGQTLSPPVSPSRSMSASPRKQKPGHQTVWRHQLERGFALWREAAAAYGPMTRAATCEAIGDLKEMRIAGLQDRAD